MYKTQIFRLPALLMSALAIFMASCQKETITRAEKPDVRTSAVKSTGTKSSTTPTVYLVVTVSDEVNFKIKSDKKGSYTHGVDNVSAYIDQYGNLQFDTNTAMSAKSTAAKREMSFIFEDLNSNCNAETGGDAKTYPGKGNYRLVTTLTSGAKKLQDLIAGESSIVSLGGGYKSSYPNPSPTDWNISYHYGNENNDGSCSDYAVVTKEQNGTWTMKGLTKPPIEVPTAALRGSDGIRKGYYYMPFSINLAKKP